MAIKAKRAANVEERNRKIAEMDIDELKDFLCMKSNRNPETCKNCTGSKSCVAGQRAMVLMNEAEARKAERKPEEKKKSPVAGMKRAEVIAKARARFEDICQHDDMIGYTMQITGWDRDTSVIRINMWKASYPDIAEKYNFRERYDVLLKSNSRKLEEENRQQFIAACQAGDIVKHVMDTFEIARKRARSKIRYWAKKYPELEKEYDVLQRLYEESNNVFSYPNQQRAQAIVRYREAKEQEDPVAFIMEKYGLCRESAASKLRAWKHQYGDESEKAEEETVSGMEEEMSIEDFLKDGTEQTVSAEEITAAVNVPNTVIKAEPADGFRKELDGKYQELAKEKAWLEDRLAWIQKAQEALVMTMNLFDPESIIGRDLTGKGA